MLKWVHAQVGACSSVRIGLFICLSVSVSVCQCASQSLAFWAATANQARLGVILPLRVMTV